ncbi:MAG: 30S ribosomal protein S6 [Planctomycetota bacterium]|nr:30S ribosomal protein S6 [Planctomycetota bacterium]MDI6787360.1 30S ribosomal protein S6 [Planctomycetota bacterium]
MFKSYEAMFLVDPAQAGKDNNKLPESISIILNKYKVKIIQVNKWADRNLAYKIKGHRRGSYYLAYLETDPTSISQIRKECDLSISILRTLILLTNAVKKKKGLKEEPLLTSSGRSDNV